MGKYTALLIAKTRMHLDAPGGTYESLPEGTPIAAVLGEMGRIALFIKGMALFEKREPIADLTRVVADLAGGTRGG